MEPPPPSFDEVFLEFIQWIITKTQDGRIVWENKSHKVVATVKSLILEFEITSAGGWRSFLIAKVEGDELLIVSGPSASEEHPQLALSLDRLFLLARRGHSAVN